MRLINIFKTVILLAAAALILFPFQVKADFTARQIIEKTKQVQEVEASWSLGIQTIKTSGGTDRSFDIEMWTKDKNEKQLMEYKSPARVKGVKFLFLDDGNNIYTYFPKTDRVRHLASHMKRQKMMGSDFSYEDMTIGNLNRDYKAFKLLGIENEQEKKCYKVEIIPSDSGPHYSKMILWVDAANFVTRRIDYYEDGELIKRMTATDIKTIENVPTPMNIMMKNLKDGGVTSIVTSEIKYSIKSDDEIFTTRNHKKR
jgi:outer membrane lipoprotein-sorting protein